MSQKINLSPFSIDSCMVLHKIVIGVLFNKKMFKISSVGGALADDLIQLSADTAIKGGMKYFDQLATNTDNSNCSYSLLDSVGKNSIEISTTQTVFTRLSASADSSLNAEKVIQEFLPFYRLINKSLNNPAIRRIGLVGEFFTLNGTNNKSTKFVSTLTKFKLKGTSSRFHLSFNDRDDTLDIVGLDAATADYWNCNYSFYPTELDSSRPTEGGMATNIDIQKYYNPAKTDISKELKIVLARFKDKRRTLKAELDEMGFIDE